MRKFKHHHAVNSKGIQEALTVLTEKKNKANGYKINLKKLNTST